MKKLNNYATKVRKQQRCLKCSKFNKKCKEIDGDWNGKCLLYKPDLLTRILNVFKKTNSPPNRPAE